MWGGRSLGVGGAGAAAAGGYLYSTDTSFERSVRFWGHAGPIVLHYWWERFRARDGADKAERYERLHTQHAPDARRAIEDLRGMFVKVGQVLSVRPEVVPDAYRREFRALQDQAPPAQWEPIQDVLERELGAPVNQVFTAIEKEPLGAASIGQAHLVEWRGRRVVVKVQYPDAAAMLRADFRCLEMLLWLVGETEALQIVSQLRGQFEVELDYAQEAVHLRGLHDSIKSSPEFSHRVVVPAPIPELTRGNVIGMEYLPGPKLELVCRQRLEALGVDFKNQSIGDWLAKQQRRSLDKLEPSPGSEDIDSDSGSNGNGTTVGTSLLARLTGRFLALALQLLGVDLLLWLAGAVANLRFRLQGLPASSEAFAAADLREILHLVLQVHGFQLFFCPFFNGDPHPGNILLLPDGRVGLIDFGQCRQLDRGEKEGLARLLVLLSEPSDAPGMDADIAAAFAATGVRSEHSDERYMSLLPRLMFCRLRPEWLDRKLLREVLQRDKVETMPTHVMMAYRAAMLLRGLCLVLQENVSVAEAWRPWAQRWLHENASSSSSSPG